MVGNYDAVLAATTAPNVMLADPDDVWRPGKISLTLRAMREAEASLGPKTPVTVCTDAEVVDSQLQPVAPSYWRWSRMNPHLADVLHRLVVESPVLTSTMMVNRALLDLASLRAKIAETTPLALITEQGENRNQLEKQWNLSGFPHDFACRGT
jgi:hypothetical protein